MIQVSLDNLINAVPALQELTKCSFKGSLSFKIGRLIREMDKELSLFENARAELIDKYAKKNEDGSFVINEIGNIELKDANKYNEEIQILLDTIIEINAEKLPMEAFDDIELSPLQASALDIIVYEE